MPQKINQKGFAAIEAIIAVIILAVVGGVGFYVWHANYQTKKIVTNISSVASPKAVKPVDPVVFKDDTGTAYSIAALAKTADQKGIAVALDKQCGQSAAQQNGSSADHTWVAVTGTKDLFLPADGGSNARIAGDFAVVNTGCYDKTVGGPQWGGGANFYVRRLHGTWTFVTGSQSEMSCSQWDGTGVPASIVGQCFDDATHADRVPKA